MNKSFFEGLQGKLSSGLFLRRGRRPKQVDLVRDTQVGVVLGAPSAGGRSAVAFTSAYSFGVGGIASAVRFMPPFTARLNEYYYNIGASTGTPTGPLLIEVREASGVVSASSTVLPGTLLTSENHTPTGSANTFQRVVFTNPPLLETNKLYYIVIGDPAGNATNYYRVWTSASISIGIAGSIVNRLGIVNTTNGYLTNGTFDGGATLHGFMVFNNGMVIGSPHTGGGTPAANTLKRGMLIEPLGLDYEIYGVQIGGSVNISAIEIFAKSQSANDPPLARQTLNDANKNLNNVFFEKPFRMFGDRAYRIVCAYSAGSSSPGQINCNTLGTFPTAANNLYDDRVMSTIQNGSSWQDGSRFGSLMYNMLVLIRRIYDPRG